MSDIMSNPHNIKRLEFNTIFLPLFLLGAASLAFIVVTVLLWGAGNVERNNLNLCETTQSSSIPRAQCDGGTGINPLRIQSTGECQTFI